MFLTHWPNNRTNSLSAKRSYRFRDLSHWIPHLESLENRLLLAADLFEPNDSPAAASDFGVGDQIHDGLTIHASNNDDWYKWTASGNGTLTVDALFSDALGNVDLQLYDSLGVTVLDSSTSITDNEQVSTSVVGGNMYLIRVFGFLGATHPSYALVIA